MEARKDTLGNRRCEAIPIGDAVAYAGSSGMLEIAIRQGSAREKLGIKKGARVVASPSYPRT